MKNVIIYSTPTCVYCRLAKKFFDENGVAYKDINVAADSEARKKAVTDSGQLGVPVIDVDGQIVVGFDQERLS